MRSRPVLKGVLIGLVGYWAIQHFTGAGTSGKGAQQSAGAGKPPAGN